LINRPRFKIPIQIDIFHSRFRKGSMKMWLIKKKEKSLSIKKLRMYWWY